jgi:hypothetical protein
MSRFRLGHDGRNEQLFVCYQLRWTKMTSWRAASLITAVVLVISAGTAPAAEVRRLAFFGFFLINTSLEPTQPAEKRLEKLGVILREQLAGGGRFSFVAIPPEVQKQAVAGSGIPNCNGCERDLAEKTGAELVAWGTVQKVSNLILNINLYIEDVQTGKIEFAHGVDIRGNTDESWHHGLNYMIRHYILKQP